MTPKLIVTDRAGTETIVDGAVGLSVMEILRDAGFDDIQALCNGSCSCATCHVYVDGKFEPLLPAMSEDEDDLLEGSDHRQNSSRLSCQLKFAEELDGLRVRIAPED
jgi:2Fe-2S ferredoxin